MRDARARTIRLEQQCSLEVGTSRRAADNIISVGEAADDEERLSFYFPSRRQRAQEARQVYAFDFAFERQAAFGLQSAARRISTSLLAALILYTGCPPESPCRMPACGSFTQKDIRAHRSITPQYRR